MAPDISLIIPIYKAEAFLAQTLETIDAHLTNTSFSWELVLAIDASPDQSLEICQQFAAIPRPYSVQILNHRNNLGKGGNVRAAMLASHGSYRIFNDCDLAYPMSEVERILKALQQGADVAIANRVHPESRYTISPKDFTYLFTRHLSSRIYNYLVNWTFLPECRDTQAGLKGFTAKAAHKLFSEQRLRGFSFDVEILHLAHQMGFTIAETPVNYVYHEEPSTINFLRDAVRMAKDIYRIHRWTRQKIYHLDPDVESEKQIVLTADDFGFSPAVNEAIVTLSKQGRIGATSLLVNLPASAQAFELAKVHGLDVGWHANLTFGPPVCAPGEVPSLVDEQGTFFPLRTFLLKMLRKQIEVADVRKELAAQYALFSQHQLKISHVDGHQHVHVLPGISRVLGELLSSTPGIFVRVPRERAPLQLRRLVARMFLSCFPANRAAFWEAFGCKVLPFFGLTLLPEAGRLEAWQKLFQDLPSGVCEIMVHPSTAESDNEHLGDCYPGDRHAEYELLKSPEFADALSKAGLSIIDFRHLSPVSDA